MERSLKRETCVKSDENCENVFCRRVPLASVVDARERALARHSVVVTECLSQAAPMGEEAADVPQLTQTRL